MASPYLQTEALPPVDAGLVTHLVVGAQRLRQQTDPQQACQAAIVALRDTPYSGLILRLQADGQRLTVAATSLPAEQDDRLREQVAQGDPSRMNGIGVALMQRLRCDDVQTACVGELCSELVEGSQVKTVSAWLGGPQRSCLIVRLSAGDQPMGLLCVVTDHVESDAELAVQLFASHLTTALVLTEMVSHLQRARSSLSADHPVQLHLGRALRITGQTAPGAYRSLILHNETPPSSELSWSKRPLVRILLVEDDERLRKSTGALLDGLGYAVESVASGEQALTCYARAREQGQAFSLVLMDQTLSGRMNGVETLRLLRSMDPQTRAILLSGQSSDRHDDQMRKHGFRECLAKPVSLGRLQATIQAVLDQPA